MVEADRMRNHARALVRAYLDRQDAPENNSLPCPKRIYCNMVHEIQATSNVLNARKKREQFEGYIDEIVRDLQELDPEEFSGNLRQAYTRFLKRRKGNRAVPRPCTGGYLAGGSDRKTVPTSVRLPTTAERGGRTIGDFLKPDALTERAIYVAQEMAKPDRDYTPELAYYNIAPTLNGQKEDFDKIVRKEATRLGMNGAEVVEYLNKMNNFLAQTKDIVQVAKDPQSRKKPDVMYTAAVCNANGHKVLFDMVLDLEARKHRVLGLVERLQAQYEELMAQSGKLGSDIVVSRTDIGEQERSTGQARRATGAIGYDGFAQQMTGADQAEGFKVGEIGVIGTEEKDKTPIGTRVFEDAAKQRLADFFGE